MDIGVADREVTVGKHIGEKLSQQPPDWWNMSGSCCLLRLGGDGFVHRSSCVGPVGASLYQCARVDPRLRLQIALRAASAFRLSKAAGRRRPTEVAAVGRAGVAGSEGVELADAQRVR